jgi:predicted nucleic acid-binding protein
VDAEFPNVPGILDTSVVQDALTQDSWSEGCRTFLRRLEDGSVQAIIDPVVVHELTYSIPRYLKGASRAQIADIILVVLEVAGTVDLTGILESSLVRWRDTPGLSFVDAYLGTWALAEGRPVYTVNRRDFQRQGVEAPDIRELTAPGAE